MSRRTSIRVAAVLGVAPILCLGVAARSFAAVADPNVLLITIDTLRADRVGCYGYAAAATPVIDRLAREGVLLEDATVQVPQTRPSHASFLTGRWPFEHGVRDNFAPRLDPSVPTLASHLKGRGYDTAAFIGSFILARSSGLDRGFDLYDDPFSAAGRGSALYERPERRASEVVDDVLAWLAKPRERPFFAWVHLYDPHAPYEAPAPFGGRFARVPYDGEVAYADQQMGRLVTWLDRRGLREETLVVVTSDHGEGLGEHGEDEHMLLVYESTLRIPLVASWPGTLPAGRRVAGQFRSVDLLATLVELVGAPAVATSGASRASNLRTGTTIPDNESYAESLYGNIHFGYAPLRALRAEGWKYIDAPRPELFHLREDAGEARNLAELRSQVAGRMQARLRSYASARSAPPPKVSPDAGTLERLAALGYVGGSGPRGGASTGADPKDKIGEVQTFIRDVEKAKKLTRAGNWDEALPILERLSRGEILAYEVELMWGRALMRKRRFTDAAVALEDALKLVPSHAETYVLLARAYAGAGRADEAVRVLERGAAVDARSPVFPREKGVLLQQKGDASGAVASLEKARDLDPKDSRTRLALSAVYRDQGSPARAIAELREAVRLDPRAADAWNALGTLLAANGDDAGAEKAFRSGLDVDRDDPDMLFGLAGVALRRDDPATAIPLLERLREKAPDYPGAAAALSEARRRAGPIADGHARLRVWRSSDRNLLEAVRRALSSGQAPLAAGESLGTVRIADLQEPLRTAAAGLRPGGSSEILEIAGGLALIARER